MDEMIYDLRGARRSFSRIGFALAAILAVGMAAQVVISAVILAIFGLNSSVLSSSWVMWLLSFLPLYLIAIPVGLLILRRLPAESPPEHKLGAGNAVVFFLISVFIMYTGSILGTMLSMILSGGEATNATAELAMDNHPLKVLFMVILAPVLEEYVFRKQLIDRAHRYGEKTAVMLSAVTFGLLHQNLFQFFYAFGLGLLLAYIYLRTGRLRYSAILHAIINFMGSVLAPWVLNLVDQEALLAMESSLPTDETLVQYMDILPGLLVMSGYMMLLMGMFIAGLVLFIIKCRRLVWRESEAQLPRGTALRTVYCNGGMVLYMLLCLVMIVFSLFA